MGSAGFFTLPEGAHSPLRFDRFQGFHKGEEQWSAHTRVALLYRSVLHPLPLEQASPDPPDLHFLTLLHTKGS